MEKRREQISIRKYLLLYTIIFSVTALACFTVFIYRRRSFVWKTDGGSQYLPYLAYMGQYLRQFISDLVHGEPSHIMYDFRIGMGDDVGNVIRAHPLEFLSVFVPVRYTEYLYDAIVILRLYLAGLSFSAYGLYFGYAQISVLAGSIIYVFCGQALHLGIMHPTFLTAFIILPLLLLGAEKMLRGEHFAVFSLAAFLGFTSQYYFMYMCTMAMAVYVLLRYRALHAGKGAGHFFRLLVRMIGAFLLGAGMACLTLLPVIMSLGGTARFVVDSGSENLLVYKDTARYYRWFLDLIFPHRGTGSNTYLNYSVFVLPFLAVLFTKRDRGYRVLKTGLLIATLALLIPFGGYAMAGFSNVTNRWLFIYAFLMGCMAMMLFDRLTCLDKRERKSIAALSLLYICCIVLDVWVQKRKTSLLGGIILIGALVVLFLLNRLSVSAAIKRKMLLVLICGSVAMNGFIGYSYYGKAFSKQFLKAGKGISRIEKASINRLAVEDEDAGFYRTDTSLYIIGKENYSLLLGYQGTYMYNSLLNGPLMVSLVEQENAGANASIRLHGLGGRFAAENLANVKYYLVKRSSTRNVPYGFRIREDLSDQKYAVYENTMPAAFGYTYDTIVDSESYEKLNAAEKEQLLLYGAVVDTGNADVADMAVADAAALLEEAAEPLLYESLDMPAGNELVTRTDNGYKAAKKNAKLTFTATMKAGYECYLELDSFYSAKNKAIVWVRSDAQKTPVTLRGLGAAYSLGKRSYIVRLGYFDADTDNEITLQFKKKGSYELAGMRLIYVPVSGYEEAVDGLNEDAMYNVNLEGNTITGEADLKQTECMVFSIPYKNGWTLYVDGEKHPLLSVNTAYTGAVLSAGHHEIRLTYRTPGSRAGGWTAGCAWLIFVMLNVAFWWRRRQK